MSTKKKLLFLEDDTADGGLGMVFRSLANHFKDIFDVIYVSVRENNERLPHEIEYIKMVEYFSFNITRNGIGRSLWGVLPLRRILKFVRPDIVISFGLYSNIRANLASLGLKHKLIISERGNASRFDGFNKFLLQILLSRSNKIVFQSKAALNCYPDKLKRKGVVIPNAIFKDNLPDFSNVDWEKKIVSVGRIHTDKNFPLLIKAFDRISKEYPDYQLEIIGAEEVGSKHSHLTELKTLVNQLNIQDKVIFVGQVNQVETVLEGRRLFVLSSTLEGMPNALIEAMSCGLPCVTTDFKPGNANELIDDGINGVISPNEDYEALARNCMMLLDNDRLSRSMASNAYQIRQKLSKDRILSEWERAFFEVIGKNVEDC